MDLELTEQALSKNNKQGASSSISDMLNIVQDFDIGVNLVVSRE
jgi:hypothetical protein